jgi:hypothetical protein
MKIKITIILLILAVNIDFTKACSSTYQFKIFPVGIKNDTIYTVDFKIRRMNPGAGAYTLMKLGIIDFPKRRLFKKTFLISDLEPKIYWMIYAYKLLFDFIENLEKWTHGKTIK